MNDIDLQRERERQQALMGALLSRDDGTALRGWSQQSPQRLQRGLQAYQANAGAAAERALAATFCTVQALVGEESFAVLARALWHARPPVQGDLACFGEALPAFIAGSEQLADVPYLADTAQLEWLIAVAERAADAQADLSTLALLAETDPAELQLELRPGTALLMSNHPVVSVWFAHRPGPDAHRHAEMARLALAAGAGECALVWRDAWCASVLAVDEPTARWMHGLLRGATLATALSEAGEGFAFEPWLAAALQSGWVLRACKVSRALATKP